MLSSLFLLLALSAEPTIDVRGWTPVQYNDAIVHDQYAAFRVLFRSLVALGEIEDPAAFEAGLAQVQAGARTALDTVARYPAYKGDSELRDAVTTSFRWTLEQTEKTLPELYGLYLKPEVRNADLARAEELVTALNVGGKALDDRVEAAQLNFARKNGMILLESEPLPQLDSPEFSLPGFPPKGSALSGQVHMSFVLRYHNALAARQTAMADAMNAFFDATTGDLGQVSAARERALARVRTERAAVEATEDWQGDASLRDAILELGAALEGALTGPFSEYVALISQVRLKPKDADRANKLAEEGNRAVSAAFDRFNPRYDDFRARWHFAEYEAWVAANATP